jgi:hypothetical protein
MINLMKSILIGCFLVALFLLNCTAQSNGKHLLQHKQCQDTLVSDSIYFNYLAFNKTNYSTSVVSKYFNDNIKIDSVEKKDNQGYKYLIYTYFDKQSKISFMVKPKETNDDYFYILNADISSNCVKLINGIQIEMTKDNVIKKLGIRNFICDTLIVIGGESYTRLTMIFKEEKLQRIIFPQEGAVIE